MIFVVKSSSLKDNRLVLNRGIIVDFWGLLDCVLNQVGPGTYVLYHGDKALVWILSEQEPASNILHRKENEQSMATEIDMFSALISVCPTHFCFLHVTALQNHPHFPFLHLTEVYIQTLFYLPSQSIT